MGGSFRSEMATLCVVRYDPVAGSASAASAGHPPPVLISPNGTSHAAAVVPGLPLGVLAATTYEQATLDLPAGSGLVLYTDGLIERRGEVVDEGLARLITHTTGVLDDAGVLAERVIQHLVPDDGPTDDVALLVMRVGVAGPALSIVIEPDAGELASVRHDVELWVGPTGAADDDIGDLVLAINEAAANAVEHAYVGAHKREQVRVRGTVEKGCVEVTVCDQGTWRAPWGSRHRGRGIDLIRALVDDVDIATTPAGTSVRLRKALFAPLP
jgi:anti-sigma regulatory factor (Ser/Thr protein kinase)